MNIALNIIFNWYKLWEYVLIFLLNKINWPKISSKIKLNFNVFLLVLDITHFILINPIGKGGFGKVWKIKRKKDNKLYALK